MKELKKYMFTHVLYDLKKVYVLALFQDVLKKVSLHVLFINTLKKIEPQSQNLGFTLAQYNS